MAEVGSAPLITGPLPSTLVNLSWQAIFLGSLVVQQVFEILDR